MLGQGRPIRPLPSPAADRRQRRVLALVQHMSMIDELIGIFEAAGGQCEIRNGTKVFPWTTLPAHLAATRTYFAGWPECCLPRMSGLQRNAIDPASDPMWWSAEQRRAMRTQLDRKAVLLQHRPPNGGPVLFEFVDITGAPRETLLGFSTKWYHKAALSPLLPVQQPSSTSPQQASSSSSVEFFPSATFLDNYFQSLAAGPAAPIPSTSYSSPHPIKAKRAGTGGRTGQAGGEAVGEEEEDYTPPNSAGAASQCSSPGMRHRTLSGDPTENPPLPQHLENRLRELLTGIPSYSLPEKRPRREEAPAAVPTTATTTMAVGTAGGDGEDEKENMWLPGGVPLFPCSYPGFAHLASSSSHSSSLSSLSKANVDEPAAKRRRLYDSREATNHSHSISRSSLSPKMSYIPPRDHGIDVLPMGDSLLR